MPKFRMAVAAMVAFLLLVSVAAANHVSSFIATCTGVSATFDQFGDSNKPISWTVSVDSVNTLSGNFTFPGSSGTLTADFSQTLSAGDHAVGFVATWPYQGENNGKFSQVVHGCPGPPPPPPVPVPPAVVPPVVPPNVSTPPPTTVKRTPPKKHRKACKYGRKHLVNSHGKHFTLCRSKPKPPVVRRPHFTG